MKNEWSEKKVSLSGAIIGSVVTLVIGIFIGFNGEKLFSSWGPYLGYSSKSEGLDFSSVNNLYKEVANYYDGDIDKDALIEGAKKGMIAAIGDPYTEYMNAKEATEYKSALEGDINTAGVGVEMAKREDYVKVIRTLPDNPARKAGVLAGDIIYAINDEIVWDKDSSTIAGKLRGEAGTQVKLTVVRNNKTIDFNLTREAINNVSADITYNGDIAVISVYRFSQDTGSLVSSFQDEIKQKGINKIILDLRNNGGGYVAAARELLSLWINGEKVLTQKTRNATDTVTYATRDKAVFADMKTVVLINNSTASASEIVAGAMQDYKKATIVGETSYGKGVVQQMLTVDGNALLKVTIAHWYTPNGVCINGEGIKPDVEVERTYEQINKDIDPQMSKAKELLK